MRRGRFSAVQLPWEMPWATPVILFGVVLLSYGLWIPWMGLFGNDLPYLWYYHLLGPWGPGEFASIDRPFSALFYAVSTAVLGETVWHYHVFLLLLRWLSAVLLWWVLGLVWPERKRETALAALLFAVYPGFRQSPAALEFILHFCVLDLFLVSLGVSLLSTCRPKLLGLLAVVSMLGAAGLFWLEYFIGLEILRPIFLWLVTRRQGLSGRRQWKRILAGWLPALGVVLAFLAWRVLVFSFPTYKPVLLQELRARPLPGLLHLAQTAARDTWTALVRAWLQTMRLPEGGRSLIIYFALAACAGGLVWLLWRRAEKDTLMPGGARPWGKRFWGESVLGIGLVAMLAGGSVFWLTGIPVTLAFPWDRSTLSFMLGASLAAVGLLEMTVTPRYRPLAAAGLVALAVGMHFGNAQEYRAEWQKLRDFTWQLTWRAPQLQPGTLAMFDVLPLDRYSDNDLTALLNWTYAPDQHSRQIGYRFFDLNLRLDDRDAGLPGLEKDLPVESSLRGVVFQSTTSSSLAVAYNPPGCLKILGPQDALLPAVTGKLAQVLLMTRLEQIREDAVPAASSGVEASASEEAAHAVLARPPAQLGREPAHGWCYYFEKAELARQQQDWQEVAALGDQARQANLRWNNPSELLPFIEGYALSANLEQARALSTEAARQANLHPALCALWKEIDSRMKTASGEQDRLGCQQ